MVTRNTAFQPVSRSLPEQGEASDAATTPGPAPADGMLQQVLAGRQGGADMRGFHAGIEAGQRVLGNRAFMRWVGQIESGGWDVAAQGLLPAAHRPQGPPLQLMPKKKKKPPAEVGAGSGEQAAAAQGEAGTEAKGTAAPGPDAAQPQATGTVAGVEPEPVGGAMGGGKKKKKSRVQVALNTLRGEGVAAFGGYIGAEIGEEALLRTLVERIDRAEDLAGVRKEALGVVEARRRLLDPGADAGAPAPGRQEPEKAEIAQVKAELSLRDIMLFNACIEGNIRTLRRFLRHGETDINMSDEQATLLGHAAYRGSADIVEVLLQRPEINVNLAIQSGAPPLYLAATQGHAAVVRLLLGAPGINVNRTNANGITPLFIATQAGHEEVVGLLLSVQGIDVDTQKSDGATALYMAVQSGFTGIVERLVRAGADVNLGLNNGTTPLCNAVASGDLEIVKCLLRAHGIRVNQPSYAGVTSLGMAARQGHKEIVRLLLRHKADPNIPARDGATPLHLACLGGNTAIVEMLLHAGADTAAEINVTEDKTLLPYAAAELSGHREVMSVLAAHRRRREAPPRPAQLSITAEPDTTGQATARVSPVPPAPSPPGEAAAGTGPPTPGITGWRSRR